VQPPAVRSQQTEDRGQAPQAAIQQPQRPRIVPPPRRHKVPDNLVDPNMLAPPPPIAKPKATHVSVVCYLCGTRIDVPLDQIGRTIKCPDCHARNEVVAPVTTPPPAKSAGPSLEGVEEFELSDPGERPAYRPLVAPRGEYEVLSALDPGTMTHGWTLPEDPADTGDNSNDDEMRLSAPVERVELKHEPIKLPEPDPEEAMYDGRYDDGVLGDNVNPRQSESWKKAPFLIGLVEFLFYLGTLPRWIFYSIGLIAVVNLIHGTIAAATAGTILGEALQIPLVIMSSVAVLIWTPSFLAVLLAIVEDTANGMNEVTGWPDWNIFDWIVNSLYFPAAIFAAGLPGGLIAAALLFSGMDPAIASFAIAAPVVASLVILLPLVFGSMLSDGTILSPFSPRVFRSFVAASDGWVLFYMYSILLVILAAAAGSLVVVRQPLVASLGAVGVVTLAILYARLLGRLMWYAAEKDAKLAAREALGRPAP
jgi:hypothetical protein